MIENMVLKSSQLIYKGMLPKATPERDKEYKELLRLSLSSNEFTQTVHDIAEGLSLVVVDISERGIILSPRSTESRFAMGIGDYRKELEGELESDQGDAVAKRGLMALVQVAVAATFFPTADNLDDDDFEALSKSATAKDINDVLVAMCERIHQEQDQEVIAPSVRKGASMILAMPDLLPTQKTNTLKSRFGAIGIVTSHLDKTGLIKFLDTSDGGGYFPTYRYQQLLKRRAAGRLFEICHEFAQPGSQVKGEQ